MQKKERLVIRVAFFWVLFGATQVWANPLTLSPMERLVKPSTTVSYHCTGYVTNYETTMKSGSFQVDQFVTLCPYSCSHSLSSVEAARTNFSLAIVDHGAGGNMGVEVGFPHSVGTTVTLASDTKYFDISAHNTGDPALVMADIQCTKNEN